MSFVAKTSSINKVIPDNSDSGLVDSIKVFKGGKATSIEVSVNIKHPYSGDLEIHLTAPSGKTIVLHGRTGSSKPNIVKVFGAQTTAKLIGESVKGDWNLTVKDFAPRDEGILQSWSLQIENDAKKEASEIFIPDGKGKKLVSKQVCNVAGKVKSISASINIKHAYIGDLDVTLVGPGGSVKLHSRAGGNKKNLKKTYKKELTKLVGTNAKGVWALEVKDYAPRDAGQIKSWNIDLVV